MKIEIFPDYTDIRGLERAVNKFMKGKKVLDIQSVAKYIERDYGYEPLLVCSVIVVYDDEPLTYKADSSVLYPSKTPTFRSLL